MNEIEKKDFHNKLYTIPKWVKTEEDYKKYIAHIHFRLYQKKSEYSSLCSYLSMFHTDLYNEIDVKMLNLINKESMEMENEYNNINHPDFQKMIEKNQ